VSFLGSSHQLLQYVRVRLSFPLLLPRRNDCALTSSSSDLTPCRAVIASSVRAVSYSVLDAFTNLFRLSFRSVVICSPLRSIGIRIKQGKAKKVGE
jgi:hypothetical protein